MGTFTAEADVRVEAPVEDVWRALTDPELIAQYFFGSRVTTDWRPGSSITWTGEYQGKTFEDKGEILDVEENRLLRMSHYSPMSGQPDAPESYHTLTYRLEREDGGATHVWLSQDNNGSEEEAQRARANWAAMLDGLKRTAEGG